MARHHVYAKFINMHKTPKVPAEGHGRPPMMAAEGEGHLRLVTRISTQVKNATLITIVPIVVVVTLSVISCDTDE